jgi:hypothetical protein
MHQKPLCTESYSMGYWFMWVWVIWWQIAAAFLVRRGNGPKKLIFHLLDLTILNNFISHKMCGGKHTSVVLRTTCRSPIPVAQDINPRPSTSRHGRPPSREVHHFCLDFKDSNHWPAKSCFWGCNVCCSQGKTLLLWRMWCRARCLSVLHIVPHQTPLLSIAQFGKWLGAMELFDV